MKKGKSKKWKFRFFKNPEEKSSKFDLKFEFSFQKSHWAKLLIQNKEILIWMVYFIWTLKIKYLIVLEEHQIFEGKLDKRYSLKKSLEMMLWSKKLRASVDIWIDRRIGKWQTLTRIWIMKSSYSILMWHLLLSSENYQIHQQWNDLKTLMFQETEMDQDLKYEWCEVFRNANSEREEMLQKWNFMRMKENKVLNLLKELFSNHWNLEW